MKSYSFLFILLCLLSTAVIGYAGNIEQTLVRTISYDPHPSTAAFADKVPFNGDLIDLEVEFHETWKEIKDYALLSQISFTLKTLKNGAVSGEVASKKLTLDKIKKGQTLETLALGEINLTINVDEIQKKGNGITDITLTFKASYPEASLHTVSEQQSEKQPPISLTLARKLAEKAESMPDSNPQAKTALFKKALAAAPMPDSSPEAAAFYLAINDKIELLKAKMPEKGAAVSNKAVTVSENLPAPDKSVNAEAKELLKQARSFFAQEKGPEGREALRKALEIAPDFHEALIVLGDNNFSNRRYARSKEAYDKALGLLDRDSETLLKYFKACYYLGEGAEAIIRLENANRKFLNDKRIRFALAEAYFQLGDLTSSQAVCSDILNSEPTNVRAVDLMSRINRLIK